MRSIQARWQPDDPSLSSAVLRGNESARVIPGHGEPIPASRYNVGRSGEQAFGCRGKTPVPSCPLSRPRGSKLGEDPPLGAGTGTISRDLGDDGGRGGSGVEGGVAPVVTPKKDKTKGEEELGSALRLAPYLPAKEVAGVEVGHDVFPKPVEFEGAVSELESPAKVRKRPRDATLAPVHALEETINLVSAGSRTIHRLDAFAGSMPPWLRPFVRDVPSSHVLQESSPTLRQRE